jgi:hypothetical protein
MFMDHEQTGILTRYGRRAMALLVLVGAVLLWSVFLIHHEIDHNPGEAHWTRACVLHVFTDEELELWMRVFPELESGDRLIARECYTEGI